MNYVGLSMLIFAIFITFDLSCELYYQQIENDIKADTIRNVTSVESLIQCTSLCGHTDMCIIVKYIEPNKNCILFSKLWREVIFVKERTVPMSGEVTYMVRYVSWLFQPHYKS